MSGKVALSEARKRLKASRRSIRCGDLTKLLEGLGFEVRDGKLGGHKLFIHDGLLGFTSASFNCGHGKNPEVKLAYISKILKLLETYEAELITYLDRS